MRKLKTTRLAASLIGVSLLINGAVLVAQDTGRQQPDNTDVNKSDRDKTEPTADQAKNNQTDRDIMQKIRRAVMADKSLSSYAHNVKIISEHGKVTLKGPVHSAEERQSVEAKAIEVAGAGNVTNQLTIKSAKPAGK